MKVDHPNKPEGTSPGPRDHSEPSDSQAGDPAHAGAPHAKLFLKGEAIKARLKQLNENQIPIGKILGIDQKNTSKRLAKNAKCTLAQAIAIAKHLGGEWQLYAAPKEVLAAPANEPNTQDIGADAIFNDIYDTISMLKAAFMRPGPPQTVHAAISEGNFLGPLLSSLENDVGAAKANIKDINITTISDSTLEALEHLKAIDQNYRRDLHANIEKLRDVSKRRGGILTIKTWEALPPIWGILVGDTLIIGHWGTNLQGHLFARLRSHMVLRNGRHQREFEIWSSIIRGDGQATLSLNSARDETPEERASRRGQLTRPSDSKPKKHHRAKRRT